MQKIAFVALILLLLVNLPSPALSGCPDCYARGCLGSVSGNKFGCKCYPTDEFLRKGVCWKGISQDVIDCAADVFGCAQNALQNLIPSLDTTTCQTEKFKQRAQSGGWKVFYGPRVWDSKVIGNAALFFFPATSAVAAANLRAELNRQIRGLVDALEAALKEEGNRAVTSVSKLFENLFEDLLAGKAPQITLGKLSVKLQIFRVPCQNDLPGFTLPSEGYTRWVFGWKFPSSIESRFALTSGKESTGTSLQTGGREQLPAVYKMAIRLRNSCSEPIFIAVTWKLPADYGKKCLNGFVNPNNWCVQGWYSFAVDEDAKIGDTGNQYFYYTAYSASGRVWGSDENWDLKLQSCRRGAPGCQTWDKVDTSARMLKFWTQSLTCRNPRTAPPAQATAYATAASALAPTSNISSIVGTFPAFVQGPTIAAASLGPSIPDPQEYTLAPAPAPGPATMDTTLLRAISGEIPLVFSLPPQGADGFTFFDDSGRQFGAPLAPTQAQGPVEFGVLSDFGGAPSGLSPTPGLGLSPDTPVVLPAITPAPAPTNGSVRVTAPAPQISRPILPPASAPTPQVSRPGTPPPTAPAPQAPPTATLPMLAQAPAPSPNTNANTNIAGRKLLE